MQWWWLMSLIAWCYTCPFARYLLAYHPVLPEYRNSFEHLVFSVELAWFHLNQSYLFSVLSEEFLALHQLIMYIFNHLVLINMMLFWWSDAQSTTYEPLVPIVLIMLFITYLIFSVLSLQDDTAFEKQSALFALAVSDIVMINLWVTSSHITPSLKVRNLVSREMF